MKTTTSILSVVLFVVLFIASTITGSAQNWSNVQGIAASGPSKHAGIKIDQSGNTYVAGSFQSTVDFTAFSFTATGGDNHAYLVKYDPSGTAMHGLEFVSIECEITGIDISSQYLYIVGYYVGTLSIASHVLPTTVGYESFVAKVHASDLSVVWVNSYGSVNDQIITSIASHGSMLGVTGIFYSTLQIGPYFFSDATNNGDMFIAGIDTAGTVVFAQARGSSLREAGTSITVDASGNWYVQGQFESDSLVCATASLVNRGTQNFFIVKFSQTGTEVWAVSGGSVGYDYSRGIAVSGNHLSIVGVFDQGNIVFGQYGIQDIGMYSYCVATYNLITGTNTGAVAVVVGSGVSPSDGSISVGQNGDMYLTGTFSGSQLIGETTYTAFGLRDGFIARYAPWSNTVVSACQTGGAGDESPTAICAGMNGEAKIIGSYAGGSTTFGSTTLTNADAFADGFLATVSLPLAIPEENSLNVLITQNLFSGTVVVTLPENAQYQISMSDMFGRELKSIAIFGSTEINCENLTPGVYLVSVSSIQARYCKKVMIQ
ncbi:MAG: T9SS type A sorting domain-containing protein [Candidatus Pacebacteria bacterium]|jgi:hypothetical protein|nr:T9SS type A sorting domain-containing protein [Candidatus Paceibacterota bacterium]